MNYSNSLIPFHCIRVDTYLENGLLASEKF